MSGRRPAPARAASGSGCCWRGWSSASSGCGRHCGRPSRCSAFSLPCRCSGCGSACRSGCICRRCWPVRGLPCAGPSGGPRQTLRLAGRDAGLARLEHDSGVTHQPLRALDDTLPGDFADPATRRLWALHRQRLITSLERLQLAPPRSDLPRRDPWALAGGTAAGAGRGAGPRSWRDRPAPAQWLHLRRPSRRAAASRRPSICGSRRRPIPAARRW